MEKEIVKDRDYAKLLFISVVSIGAMAIFGSIGYISLESNLSINEDATHPLMACIWMAWITVVPLALFVISFVVGGALFIEAWELEDDDEEED